MSTNAHRTLRTITDLVEAGLVPHAQAEKLSAVAERYAVAVTPHMRGVMDGGGPLARQFVPSVE